MIFISKNEEGIPAWKLVMEGKKTVTRRLKPVEIGKIIAVQPGRCKKAIAYIEIVDCQKHSDWWNEMMDSFCFFEVDMEDEAKKEGFKSWSGMLKWFKDHKININKTYRLEFDFKR